MVFRKDVFFLLDHIKIRYSRFDSLSPAPTSSIELTEDEITEYVVGEDGTLVEPTESSSSTEITSLPNEEATPKLKKPKQTAASGDIFLKEASAALATISTKLSSPPQQKPAVTGENEALANFIISLLSKIENDEVRLNTEDKLFTYCLMPSGNVINKVLY